MLKTPVQEDRAGLRNRRSLTAIVALLTVPTFALAALGPLAALCALVLTVLALAPYMRLPRGVPVLTYHSVSPDASWLPWAAETSIRPESLKRQLVLFERMGYTTVPTMDLTRARQEGASLPARPLVLHFDDGYLDNRIHAWPLLRTHGAVATMFVSTDFIEPGDALRHDGPDDGFLTWAELRDMDGAPEWTVEAHGTDHGRLPISERTAGKLTSANFAAEAWLQWNAMPGPKHDWYRRTNLPVPMGTAIPESRPALAGPAHRESQAAYEARVANVLATSRKTLARELGRAPQVFCWPENQTSSAARRIAAEAGFAVTTGARHRNTAADPATEIARLHIGQDYAGFRSGALDDLAVAAHLRAFEGNLWWGIPLLGIAALRKVVRRLPLKSETRPQASEVQTA